ncbi:MAG TPA: serine hydrolase domain-containing protein [Polyangiaceae bacterium]
MAIGKAMAATAAMELVEAGRLELDSPIQKYCPTFPEKDHPITPWHLLTHTSGIVHYLLLDLVRHRAPRPNSPSSPQ